MEFKFLEKLGQGRFASVYKIQHNFTNKYYVAKIVNEKDRDDITREHNILKDVRHQYVITSHNVSNIYHDGDRCFAAILDYYPGAPIDIACQEADNKDIFILQASYQILLALKYLHDKMIAHRDIKEDNLLWDQGQVKIIDFGFASSPDYQCRRLKGTPYYMAPEIFNGYLNVNSYWDQSILTSGDVWSLGVTLFRLAYHKYPYNAKNYKGLKDLLAEDLTIKQDKLNFDFTRPIIDKSLVKIADRPTSSMLLKDVESLIVDL